MKVILRNTANDLYVLDQDLWTNDQNKARDFGRADRALEAARQSGLKDLEVMISLNGIHFDISREIHF
jgi:hypothetical protein